MIRDIITYTTLRENLAKVMDEVCDSAAPVVITRQNKRPVVMISYEEFRGIQDKLNLLNNPANADRLRQSIAQLNAGNLAEHDLYEPARRYDLPAPKPAANLSLNDALIADAKALEIDISKAAETGLAQAVKEKRTELWLRENGAALDSSNDYVEKHGLPLARYRQF